MTARISWRACRAVLNFPAARLFRMALGFLILVPIALAGIFIILGIRGSVLSSPSDWLLVALGAIGYVGAAQSLKFWEKYSKIEEAAGYTTNRVGYLSVKRIEWKTGQILGDSNTKTLANSSSPDPVEAGVIAIKPSQWHRLVIAAYLGLCTLIAARIGVSLTQIDDGYFVLFVGVAGAVLTASVPIVLILRSEQRRRQTSRLLRYCSGQKIEVGGEKPLLFIAETWILRGEKQIVARNLLRDSPNILEIQNGILSIWTSSKSGPINIFSIPLIALSAVNVKPIDLRFQTIRGLFVEFAESDLKSMIVVAPQQLTSKSLRASSDQQFFDFTGALGF